MSGIISMKVSAVVSIIAATAVLSSGAAYIAIKASISANMSMSCPKNDTSPDKGWVLPSGPVPDIHSGKKY